MRPLAYARQIAERRKAGAQFWLAIVALGHLRDTATLAGEPGIARVGCPDDLDPAAADWRVLLALDVLVVLFAPALKGAQRALEAIWRARPATLWLADGRGRADRMQAVCLRGRTEFVPWTPARVALDARFRTEVELTRGVAFAVRSEPLYSGPEFVAARREPADHAPA